MTSTASVLHQPHWRDVLPDLERRLGADRILIATDFDGTISPIAPAPEDAVILTAARDALERLSKLAGVTAAVISGRALTDIEEKVNLPSLIYAGNHGLEMQGPSMPPLTLFMEDVRKELDGALSLLHASLDSVPGVIIEDKGSSASVHYRMVEPANFDIVAAAVTIAVNEAPQIQLRHGKMVWELRPDVAWNKGSAVVRLMARFKLRSTAVFFLGDDETDDDVFRVLPQGATFIVGDRPNGLASFRCHGPEDAAELLAWMAECRANLTTLH
ncbi:MAG TPA: trehalose-phosphatase [Verrucomicrobiales bacterium]|jgi:trehalose 6-phosphate phosphatase|nr:trehalose-phosphatase [Verrucomicrobiales bacterium]